MKSSVMALILLSMAANVQAECPVGGCGTKKWCTGPGNVRTKRSMGYLPLGGGSATP